MSAGEIVIKLNIILTVQYHPGDHVFRP